MDVAELVALVRRVVTSRVSDPDVVDDIVQETLVRLLAARSRLDDRALAPYAVVVARNLVASHWRRGGRGGRQEKHRRRPPRPPPAPDEPMIAQEDVDAVRAALQRLSAAERDVL